MRGEYWTREIQQSFGISTICVCVWCGWEVLPNCRVWPFECEQWTQLHVWAVAILWCAWRQMQRGLGTYCSEHASTAHATQQSHLSALLHSHQNIPTGNRFVYEFFATHFSARHSIYIVYAPQSTQRFGLRFYFSFFMFTEFHFGDVLPKNVVAMADFPGHTTQHTQPAAATRTSQNERMCEWLEVETFFFVSVLRSHIRRNNSMT